MKYKLIEGESIYRVELRSSDPSEAPRIKYIVSDLSLAKVAEVVGEEIEQEDSDDFIVGISVLLEDGTYRTAPDVTTENGQAAIMASVDVHTAQGVAAVDHFPICDAAIFTLGWAIQVTHFTDDEAKALWSALEVLARGKGISHIVAVEHGVLDDGAAPSPTPPAPPSAKSFPA